MATTRFTAPAFCTRNKQQRQHHRGGMSHHRRPGLQLRSERLAQLALNPRRLHLRFRFVLQSVGEIDNRAARLLRLLPVLAGAFLVGSEEGEIDFVELLRAHALDERNFVAHGLQLAQRFVVIEQLDVDRGKIAVAQHLGNLFPLQRTRAHDGQAVEIACPHRIRMRWWERI